MIVRSKIVIRYYRGKILSLTNDKSSWNVATDQQVGKKNHRTIRQHVETQLSIANQKNRRAIEFFARRGKTRTAVLSVVVPLFLSLFLPFSRSHSSCLSNYLDLHFLFALLTLAHSLFFSFPLTLCYVECKRKKRIVAPRHRGSKRWIG